MAARLYPKSVVRVQTEFLATRAHSRLHVVASHIHRLPVHRPCYTLLVATLLLPQYIGSSFARQQMLLFSSRLFASRFVVLCAVCCALLPLSQCIATTNAIYLGPSSVYSTPWDGICSPSICSPGLPCSAPADQVEVSTDACNIFFRPGDYGSDTFKLNSSGIVYLTFWTPNLGDAVQNLAVVATSTQSISLFPPGNFTSSTTSLLSNVNFQINSGTSVDVQNLQFHFDSTSTNSLLLTAAQRVNITNSSFNSSSIYKPPLATNTPLLGLKQTSITVTSSSPTAALQSIPTLSGSNAIEIYGSTTWTLKGALISSIGQIELLMSRVTVDATAITTTPQLLLDVETLSKLTIFGSSISASPSIVPQLTTTSAPITITGSSFVGISYRPTASSEFYFKLGECTFVDVSMDVQQPISWSEVDFVSQTIASVVILSRNGTVDHMTFTNPSRISGATVMIGRGSAGTIVSLTTPSKFNVSDLFLNDATLIVDNLEVTNTIKGTANGGTIKTSSLNPRWNFHSLSEVSHVSIDFTGVATLIYTPSRPLAGVSIDSVTAQFDPLPYTVSIAWPDYLPYPAPFFDYPLTSIAGHTGHEIVPSVPWSNPDLYAWNISFVAPPVLSFRTDYNASAHSMPPSTTCIPPTGFLCDANGGYYSPTSVSQESITIPPNSGTVQVTGDITVNTTITFVGTGSSIAATGCVQAPGGVSIQLEKGKNPPNGPVTLISQSASCGALNLPVAVKSAPNDCKKFRAKQSTSAAANTLTVVFSVDNSACNLKWIILGSALGGVLLIVLILALVFTFNAKARNCIRPYASRQHTKTI